MSTLNAVYPEIDFPFQKYDSKVPSNKFRIGRVINRVEQRVANIQEHRREVEGITIDGNENTFLHDDGLKIIKHKRGYTVQVSVVDSPAFVIPEQKFFLEILKRLETVYMHRYTSFLMPKQIVDILSLQEGKTRPAITIELEFDNNGEPVGEPNIFRSYFKNVKNFNDRTFGKELTVFGSPFHDELHEYGDFARTLHRKRVENSVRETNTPIPLYDLIISEIVLVLNSKVAELAADNNIPIAYAHRLNGDFRYSTHINSDRHYTRVTCPGRRALDMSIIGQVAHFSETNGKEILFQEGFFDDISRYNNTRSPYLSEQTEQHKEHSEVIKDTRKTKRFQESPEQMSDEDIKYFFHEVPQNINDAIISEVQIRLEKNQISMSTLTYIFFSNQKLTRELLERIYHKIKIFPDFGFFFRAIKDISFINFSIDSTENKDFVEYTYQIEIYGRKINQDGRYSISKEDSEYRTKSKNAGNKTLRKNIQEKIMQEYLQEILKS